MEEDQSTHIGTAIIAIPCLIVGSLALLVWLFLFLPAIMAPSGPPTANEPTTRIVLWYTVHIGTLAYPLIFFPCWFANLVLIAGRNLRPVAAVSAIPVIYIAIIFLCALNALKHKHRPLTQPHPTPVAEMCPAPPRLLHAPTFTLSER
ncbi:MAG TPA: hypothetical protein VIM11_13240 [Tepidisphaeraceae bacterium]|jgi:hypothetical protein